MTEQDRGLADGEACHQAAIDYLARGWSAIPLCPWDHVGVGKEHGRRCKSKGKAPLVSWTTYQERLPTRDEIDVWWKHWPNANVGIILGAVSGLVGIDIDGSGGRAEEELAKLCGGDLPRGVQFVTPGGGKRILYRIPAGLVLYPRASTQADKEELRFLADGTQTVVPPSRHKTGNYYRWENLDG